MLWNLINRHDVMAVVERATSGGVPSLWRRFGKPRSARVRQAWATEPGDDQWWVIDAVRRRWREKITGDGEIGFAAYLCDRHLSGRANLDALMVGCGSGHSLAQWAATGRFRRLDAFDVAPNQVARARGHVDAHDLGAIVQVRVADAATIALPAAGYDVVIAEQSLHHLSPLAEILARVGQALRPSGLLFADDFVGPSRHQWTPRQLAGANALLALLPESRRRLRNGRVKRAVVRPSVARMILTDPSEAVESARILPLLERYFELLEVRGYGGTLLEVVLSGIAHNFVDTDAETRRLLSMCFAAEDAMLAAGEITDDFVVAVGRRPETSSLAPRLAPLAGSR